MIIKSSRDVVEKNYTLNAVDFDCIKNIFPHLCDDDAIKKVSDHLTNVLNIAKSIFGQNVEFQLACNKEEFLNLVILHDDFEITNAFNETHNIRGLVISFQFRIMDDGDILMNVFPRMDRLTFDSKECSLYSDRNYIHSHYNGDGTQGNVCYGPELNQIMWSYYRKSYLSTNDYTMLFLLFETFLKYESTESIPFFKFSRLYNLPLHSVDFELFILSDINTVIDPFINTCLTYQDIDILNGQAYMNDNGIDKLIEFLLNYHIQNENNIPFFEDKNDHNKSVFLNNLIIKCNNKDEYIYFNNKFNKVKVISETEMNISKIIYDNFKVRSFILNMINNKIRDILCM